MADDLLQPTDVLSPDPGDDVQRRFRYQAAYAADVSLRMLLENEISEVYCELHEDILLKLIDGKFAGVQIKTRLSHLGPLCLEDEEVTKSIQRFVILDKKFPLCFSMFGISTNVGFSKVKNKCLQTACNLAKNGKSADLLKDRTRTKAWIKLICKNANCTEEEVISVLGKVRLRGDVASIDSIDIKIIQSLVNIPELKSQTTGVLSGLAETLISIHLKAASLPSDHTPTEFYLTSKDPKENEKKAIIKGKLITKEILQREIEKALTNPIQLFIKDSAGLAGMRRESKKVEIKMDAGGISMANIQLMKDQKYSFESQALSWLYKGEPEIASQKYDQVRLIVLSECQEAHDEHQEVDKPYGTNMLINLRKRIRSRLEKDKDKFFDLIYEHVLGVAGSLTEDCKVWWSKRFDIKE